MVSVNEIDGPETVPEDILKEIFEKQNSLALKYAEIEGMGNLLNETETNLDTKEGQIWLKDFLYRTIEEVGESYEVILDMESSNKSWDDLEPELKIHYSEELIDSLHFIIELGIIAGYKYTDLQRLDNYGKTAVGFGLSQGDSVDMYNEISFIIRHWEIVKYLTLAGNKLRNKKWKETNVLTDRKEFFKYYEAAFDSLISALRCVGNTDEDIYNLYFKKNAVNKFRQASKY